MKRNYDLVAPVYDKLAKLFIGDALRKAQVYFLRKISDHSKILIVGGGTGWILEEIANIYPQDLYIDYVDISGEMIAKAKRRFTGSNKVAFIHQSIIDFSNDTIYDFIITPFFLDNFSDATLQRVFSLLDKKLKLYGLWLYTDFQVTNNNSYRQKVLLSIMYSFFRVTCNIEAKKLPDVIALFNKYDYKFLDSKTFLQDFIITYVFEKSKETLIYGKISGKL